MNPIIIGSCAIAGVILGKVFSKNKTDTGDNINIKGNSNSNSNSNSNKHLTRKEILSAVNARVDKLERIKKKKEAENDGNNLSVNNSGIGDGGSSNDKIEKKEGNEENDEIVLDNIKENV